MGLFGFLGKALGGVAKLAGGVLLGAANQATGGVAGKALNAVKGLVAGKPKAATVAANEDQPATLKQVAALNKVTPKVQRTEYSVTGSRKEGWGFGGSRKAAAKRKPKSKVVDGLTRAQAYKLWKSNDLDRGEYWFKVFDKGGKVEKKLAAKDARMGSKPSKSGKRGGGKLRSGMLDLAAMARAWKAAGKPGSWRNWIKTNPQRVP